jgi:hypothetical protein
MRNALYFTDFRSEQPAGSWDAHLDMNCKLNQYPTLLFTRPRGKIGKCVQLFPTIFSKISLDLPRLFGSGQKLSVLQFKTEKSIESLKRSPLTVAPTPGAGLTGTVLPFESQTASAGLMQWQLSVSTDGWIEGGQ